MSEHRCCVPGCLTDRESNEKVRFTERTKVSFFKAPRDPELLEKWKRAFPMKIELTENHSVCERHFFITDVEKYYEPGPDGSRIKKGIPTLKKGAIPRIFSNLPGDSECRVKTNHVGSLPFGQPTVIKVIKLKPGTKIVVAGGNKTINADVTRRLCNNSSFVSGCSKDDTDNESSTTVKKLNFSSVLENWNSKQIGVDTTAKTSNNSSLVTLNSSVISENSSFVSENSEDINDCGSSATVNKFKIFKSISENCNAIIKPGQWWGVTATKSCLIFANWTPEHGIDRRIVITEDLTVKVYLKDSLTNMPGYEEINSLNDISSLLEKIDNLNLCRGQQVSEKKCRLYLPEGEEELKNRKGRRSMFCDVCKRFKRKLREEEKKRNDKKLHQQVTFGIRENLCLQKKVNMLKKQVAATKKIHLSRKAKEKISSPKKTKPKTPKDKNSLPPDILAHIAEHGIHCDKCPEVFTSMESLLLHMRIHRSFKCSQCIFSTDFQSKMEKHSTTHSGEEPYRCEMCSSTFNEQHLLESHMLAHTEEQHYQCGICHQTFKLSDELDIHMKNHLLVYQYKCGFCEELFCESSQLETHEALHNIS